MVQTNTVQEMQMCPLCSPNFIRSEKTILAHSIGLHVFVPKDGRESVGNDKYIYQQRSKREESKKNIKPTIQPKCRCNRCKAFMRKLGITIKI